MKMYALAGAALLATSVALPTTALAGLNGTGYSNCFIPPGMIEKLYSNPDLADFVIRSVNSDAGRGNGSELVDMYGCNFDAGGNEAEDTDPGRPNQDGGNG